MISIKSRLEAHAGFSDCLPRGFSILIYSDLLTKSWLPNYIVTGIRTQNYTTCKYKAKFRQTFSQHCRLYVQRK